MPHLLLECSDNIAPVLNFDSIFNNLHEFLAGTLPTQIESCKSRCTIYSNYFIGKDFTKSSFIHLTIKILPGRTKEIKKQVGTYVLDLFKRELAMHHREDTCISVEILDLSEQYYKF